MIFLSPGVKTREIDYSTYVGEISSCIVGMVGAATKGPVMVPTLVTSPSDFTDTFGEPTLLDYGAYCALEFLKQGNQLIYTRVGEETLARAKATISAGLITVTVKEMGTYGNNFAVELLKGDIDDEDGVTQLYKLIIYRNESQEEMFVVSFDSDRSDWIENVESYWVTVEYNEDQEIPPIIESFGGGFVKNADDKWELDVNPGDSTLDEVEFTTNVPVASRKLTVVSDDRAEGAWLPGAQVGNVVADGTNYRISGLGITFPDTSHFVPEGLPVSQGVVDTDIDYTSSAVAEGTHTWTPTGDTAVDFNTDVPAFAPDFSDLDTIDADLEATVKAQFNTWVQSLGLTSDGTTPLTESDIELGITVVMGTETETSGEKVVSDREIVEPGEETRIEQYTEITPKAKAWTAGETTPTITFALTGVYYDNTGAGAAVEGDVALAFSFDAGLTYKAVETFRQTMVREDLPDAFTIEFAIDLVSEIALTKRESIIVKCVDGDTSVVGGRATVLSAPRPVIPVPTDTPVPLTGGDDGAPVSIQKAYIGVGLYENTEDIDINLIAAPGRYETEIVNKLLEVAQNRADTLAIIDPPQGLSYRDAIAYHNGRLAGDHYPMGKLNTSYGAFFYPWVKVFDQYSGENIWLPPSGVVLAAFAYNDRVGQPWFAAAGLNRGMLTTVLELEVTLDEGKRDALYGNGNNVNALVNYKQQGFTIWGNKTLQRKSSALDRINVRRLVNMVRKAIAATSAYLIFEQNDTLTWGQWKNQVDPYLKSIQLSRGLDGFKTQMDAETVTPYYRDRNQMPGKVWLNPTRTAEFIPIDFILTNSGAEFSD